jgi:hypothetical protein
MLSGTPIFLTCLCIIYSISSKNKSSKNILELKTIGIGSCCRIDVIYIFLYCFLLLFSDIYIYIYIYILFLFRYEWKHRGSYHIHGFLWLHGAPNMEILDWSNLSYVHGENTYFDRYVIAWNPRDIHHKKIMVPRSINDEPCLLNTYQIFSSTPHDDYEHLLNHVQRHTK